MLEAEDFLNLFSEYPEWTNRELAEEFVRKDKKRVEYVIDLMDSFGENRWFVSNDPEAVAINQLSIETYLVPADALEEAVAIVLGYKEPIKKSELEENWDSYFEDVIEKIGTDKLAKKESAEDLDDEDIFKIDLG